MSKVQRTWVIEQELDAETGQYRPHYDRDGVLALMNEVEHLLFMAGGMVSFATERVQIGTLGDEPLAVSRRVIVTWQPYSPMVRPTRGAIPKRHEPLAVPEDLTPEQMEEILEREAAELDEPLSEEEEEEEVDRDLTTTGPPRPDAES